MHTDAAMAGSTLKGLLYQRSPEVPSNEPYDQDRRDAILHFILNFFFSTHAASVTVQKHLPENKVSVSNTVTSPYAEPLSSFSSRISMEVGR